MSRKHEHKDEQEKYTKSTLQFLEDLGRSIKPPDISDSVDFLSELISSLFKVDHISRGHVTCSFSVKPSVAVSFARLYFSYLLYTHQVLIYCTNDLVVLGEDNTSFNLLDQLIQRLYLHDRGNSKGFEELFLKVFELKPKEL